MKLVGVDYLSPSAAAKLTQCQRRWWWHYIGGLREGSTEALAMGGGFAHALEFDSVEAGITEYHARRAPSDILDDPARRNLEAWVAEATIREAFVGYQFRYADADRANRLEREVTHIVDMPGAARLLQVRNDGVGDLYLVEDKLRSGSAMQPAKLENEVRQGRQLTAEIYAVWRDTGELRPVQLRCVKKCDPRKWKSLTDRDEVEAVIRDHFQSEAAFVVLEATRTLEQVKEFEREFAYLATLADALAESGEPTGARNDGACFDYGRVCPALAHCQGQRSHHDLLSPTTNNQEN